MKPQQRTRRPEQDAAGRDSEPQDSEEQSRAKAAAAGRGLAESVAGAVTDQIKEASEENDEEGGKKNQEKEDEMARKEEGGDKGADRETDEEGRDKEQPGNDGVDRNEQNEKKEDEKLDKLAKILREKERRGVRKVKAEKVKPKRDVIEVGQSIPYLLSEEATMHLERFDMMKFERRIRDVVTEVVQPLQYDQKEVLNLQAELRHRQDKVEHLAMEAKQKFDRGSAQLAHYSAIDKQIVGLQTSNKDVLDIIDADMAKRTKENDQFRLDLNKIDKHIASMQADLVVALRPKGVNLDDLLEIVSQYKDECQKSFQKYSGELASKLGAVEFSYRDMQNRVEDSIQKTKNTNQGLQEVNEHVAELKVLIMNVKRQNEELKDVFTFAPRIDNLEKELRQMRLMMQQNVKDTRETLSKAVCQRQLEETILSYNFNMLDGIFGKSLDKNQNKKLDWKTQLKMNYTDWQMKIKEKFDLGVHDQEPERFKVFHNKLPTVGNLRKLNFLEHLNSQVLDKNAKRRLTDQTGMLRSNTILAVKRGVILKRSGPLEEKPITIKDFLCDRPKHGGYVPRFTRPPKEVKFLSADSFSEELSEQLSSNSDQSQQKRHVRVVPRGDVVNVVGTRRPQGALIGLSPEQKTNKFARVREKMDQQYHDSMYEYQEKVKEAKKEAEMEYWHGQAIPETLGILKRRVNIKRMHSTLGRDNRILKMGRQPPPLIVALDDASGSSGSADSSEDSSASSESRQKEKRKSRSKKRKSKKGKGGEGGKDEEEAGDAEEEVTPEQRAVNQQVATHSFKIGQSLGKAIQQKLRTAKTQIEKEKGVTFAKDGQQDDEDDSQSSGSDDDTKKKKKKDKKKKKKSSKKKGSGGEKTGRGSIMQRQLQRKMFMRDQVSKWGDVTFVKNPHAPKGMQFVNTDFLIDAHELSRAEDKIQKILISEMDQRQADMIEKIERDFSRQTKIINQRFEDSKEEIESNQTKYVEAKMAEVNRTVDALDDRIAVIRKFQEDESHALKVEISKKFVHQNMYNNALNEKLKQVVKKVHVMKNDLEIFAKQIREESQDTRSFVDRTFKQLQHFYDLVQCMVEVTFIDNIVEIQDEFDRNQMSLWGVAEYKKENAVAGPDASVPKTEKDDDAGHENKEKKTQAEEGAVAVQLKKGVADYGQEPFIKVDEDCLSCSLDRYRPMIKEAFKMACLQYKPTAVPFKGYQYARKYLLELKHKILQKKWIETVKQIDYYNELFSHILSKKNSQDEKAVKEEEIQAENYLQFLGDKLQSIYGTQGSSLIDELVLFKSLQDQVIKNPSTAALLYLEADDRLAMKKFKNQLKFDLGASKDYRSFVKATSESQKSLTKLDRKTISLIQKQQEGGDQGSAERMKAQREESMQSNAQNPELEELINLIRLSPKQRKKPRMAAARANASQTSRNLHKTVSSRRALYNTDIRETHGDKLQTEQVNQLIEEYEKQKANHAYDRRQEPIREVHSVISKDASKLLSSKRKDRKREQRPPEEIDIETQENFNKSPEHLNTSSNQKDGQEARQTESQVDSTVISAQVVPEAYANSNNLANERSQMYRASISIGEITTSGANQASNKVLNSDFKRSSLPDIKPIHIDLLGSSAREGAAVLNEAAVRRNSMKTGFQSSQRSLSNSVMFDSAAKLQSNSSLPPARGAESIGPSGMLGNSTYKIHNESIQRIQDVGKIANFLNGETSSVALNKQIGKGFKGSQIQKRDKSKNQSSMASVRSSVLNLVTKPSKRYLDNASVTESVKAALSELRNKSNRSSLAEVMKQENRTLKQMDNVAVVRGNARNLMIQDFEKITHKSKQSLKQQNDRPQMSINQLNIDKIKGFTNGYLYSQGKDGLLESLRGPFANRSSSPLKQLQQLYKQKNNEILNQSQFYMNIKLEKEMMMKKQMERRPKEQDEDKNREDEFELPERRYSEMQHAAETEYNKQASGHDGRDDDAKKSASRNGFLGTNGVHSPAALSKQINETCEPNSTHYSNENLQLDAMLSSRIQIENDKERTENNSKRDKFKKSIVSKEIQMTGSIFEAKNGRNVSERHQLTPPKKLKDARINHVISKRKQQQKDGLQTVQSNHKQEAGLAAYMSSLHRASGGLNVGQIQREIRRQSANRAEQEKLVKKEDEATGQLHETMKQAEKQLAEDAADLMRVEPREDDSIAGEQPIVHFHALQKLGAEYNLGSARDRPSYVGGAPDNAAYEEEYDATASEKTHIENEREAEARQFAYYFRKYAEVQKDLIQDTFGVGHEIGDYDSDAAQAAISGFSPSHLRTKTHEGTKSKESAQQIQKEPLRHLEVQGRKAVVSLRNSQGSQAQGGRNHGTNYEEISPGRQSEHEEVGFTPTQRVRQLQLHGHLLATGHGSQNGAGDETHDQHRLSAVGLPAEITITPFRGDDHSRMATDTYFQKQKRPFALKQRKESQNSQVSQSALSQASHADQVKSQSQMKNIYGSGGDDNYSSMGSKQSQPTRPRRPSDISINDIFSNTAKPQHPVPMHTTKLSELSGFKIKAKDGADLGTQFQKNFRKDADLSNLRQRKLDQRTIVAFNFSQPNPKEIDVNTSVRLQEPDGSRQSQKQKHHANNGNVKQQQHQRNSSSVLDSRDYSLLNVAQVAQNHNIDMIIASQQQVQSQHSGRQTSIMRSHTSSLNNLDEGHGHAADDDVGCPTDGQDTSHATQDLLEGK